MHLNKTSFELVSQQEKHLLKEERKKEEKQEESSKRGRPKGKRERMASPSQTTPLKWPTPIHLTAPVIS